MGFKKKTNLTFFLFLTLSFISLASAVDIENGTIITNTCFDQNLSISSMTLDKLVVNCTLSGDTDNITAFYNITTESTITNLKAAQTNISLFGLPVKFIVKDSTADNLLFASTASNQDYNVTIPANHQIELINDTSAPTAPSISPPDDTKQSSPVVNFTINLTDDEGLENATIYIYNETGDLVETNSTEFEDNPKSSIWEYITSLVDGIFTWFVKVFDFAGNAFSTSNRTLEIDTTLPTINISSPVDYYEYLRVGQLIDLNFTAADTQNNLSACLWDYNGTNYSIACTNGTLTSTQIAQELANYNVTVYVNDTLGNLENSTQEWEIGFLERDRVYNSDSLQTGSQNFILATVKNSDIVSSSATFTYNGDTYISTRVASGYNVNFTNTIDIPTDLVGDVPFYWTVSFTNSTGSYSFNTTTSNQTVHNITLYECFNPTPTGLTLNFTTYDSTNMTTLNSTLEATFEFYAASGSGSALMEYLFSDLNENRSNYMYCLNSSGLNVTVDAFLSYGATGYDNREYIINDGIIGNFTQNIPLYLTQTALTDIVTITVQDQNYDPISGALVAIQEWDIGTNTYYTIGTLVTSSEGQGIIDLELYTTWYRAVVTYGGEIVETTDVQKLSGTSWIITVELGVDNPYDLFGDISHGLTFDNETNITTFTWVDSSGYTQRGCLVITNATSLGEEEIENECVESVSGTIDYLITGEGSFTAYGIIYIEGYNVSEIVDVLSIQLGTDEIITTVSPFGKVISFIAIGTMGLIGVAADSVILGGVLIIVALIALMKIGFMNITWGFIWGMITIILVIILLQRRKR